MIFEDAFSLLPSSDQEKLTYIFGMWGDSGLEGKRLVSNLKYEQFLDEPSWRLLFGEIMTTHEELSQGAEVSSWAQYKRVLRTKFYASLLLKGGTIRCEEPVLVGTAMPMKIFEDYLWRHHRKRFRDREAFDFFYLHFQRSSFLHKDMKEALIKESEYLLWTTWNEEGGKKSPFYFATYKDNAHSNIIRTGLGLGDPIFHTGRLITFVFNQYFKTLTGGIRLHRPTFTDSDLCIFFLPGKDAHGMTEPLNGGQVSIDGEIIIVPARPEAVQKSKHYTLGLLKDLKIYH